ncbi:D-alanyl-D-alanine carboxypeptidase/D-alanyl-D-alanine-endopeptidase [Lysinibacillus sp. BW-2-10]|uniref:D-alanyl-D-alanine carboxypeptidase/D-alanyl-D-alanine endopeptidase n=1 Tax=Lysinibacillus sp. BW-2-10 TaxID=2590030 RepID=UPI001180CBB7|nr:D-alanyl-D-alanine carboxypeptidase/D-alanyl-D-alanine-endopeptidase [Lysinibacillus sp. BW-2-10]TSI03347.1 D-alanyl-D-alanine carboxypeptidase/D-alanyl-D-alanine-endopeptidase [Lysinibacillus sp. BW-2-10]
MKRINLLIVIMLILLPVQKFHAISNIEQVIQHQLGNNSISVSLRAIDTGEILYEKNGNVPMKPASTLKLLTAAAALDILGSNYRFHTKLYIDGEVVVDELKGDVYIKGEGDPTLQKQNFETFAAALKFYGIRKISGNIYGDDFAFSGDQLTPGIVSSDESYYYAARTSAITMSPDNDYDAGTLIIEAIPTKIGQVPDIHAIPNLSGMIIQNNARTVSPNDKTTIEIKRQYQTNTIIVSGNLPVGDPFKDWVTLQDPTINTLHAIKQTFEEEGITFSPNANIERKKIPKNAILLYAKHSTALKNLIKPFLKLSNNSIADILVKTMGKEVYGKGQTDYGVKALKIYGQSMGLTMDQWFLEDGSGISHNNRLTANELSHLLIKVQDEPNFETFYTSLPIGGQEDRIEGGSLRKRFLLAPYKDRIIAKTGHISGVYTLAGYVNTKSGRTLAFAILTNNQPSNKIDEIDEVLKKIVTQY